MVVCWRIRPNGVGLDDGCPCELISYTLPTSRAIHRANTLFKPRPLVVQSHAAGTCLLCPSRATYLLRLYSQATHPRASLPGIGMASPSIPSDSPSRRIRNRRPCRRTNPRLKRACSSSTQAVVHLDSLLPRHLLHLTGYSRPFSHTIEQISVADPSPSALHFLSPPTNIALPISSRESLDHHVHPPGPCHRHLHKDGAPRCPELNAPRLEKKLVPALNAGSITTGSRFMGNVLTSSVPRGYRARWIPIASSNTYGGKTHVRPAILFACELVSWISVRLKPVCTTCLNISSNRMKGVENMGDYSPGRRSCSDIGGGW